MAIRRVAARRALVARCQDDARKRVARMNDARERVARMNDARERVAPGVTRTGRSRLRRRVACGRRGREGEGDREGQHRTMERMGA
jgi:hypothetical protein